jgi:hypothetical protein
MISLLFTCTDPILGIYILIKAVNDEGRVSRKTGITLVSLIKNKAGLVMIHLSLNQEVPSRKNVDSESIAYVCHHLFMFYNCYLSTVHFLSGKTIISNGTVNIFVLNNNTPIELNRID